VHATTGLFLHPAGTTLGNGRARLDAECAEQVLRFWNESEMLLPSIACACYVRLSTQSDEITCETIHEGNRQRRDFHNTPQQVNFKRAQNMYVFMDLGGDRRESPCIHVLSLAPICANLQSMRQRDGTTQQATLIPRETLSTGGRRLKAMIFDDITSCPGFARQV